MSELHTQCYEFGPFRLEVNERRLVVQDGKQVRLEPLEFDLLLLLVKGAGSLQKTYDLGKTLWPDVIVEIEAAINVRIGNLRRKLGDDHRNPVFIETVRGSHLTKGYRFKASVKACAEPTDQAQSVFYISRPADSKFLKAVEEQQEGLVLVKGARQTGKTSLLKRGFTWAEESAWKCVWTDFRIFSQDDLASADKLYRKLAEGLTEWLDLNSGSKNDWNERANHNSNLKRFLREEVLAKTDDQQIVWFLEFDEQLFHCDFKDDLFGLFRDLYNRHSLKTVPFNRLRLVISYSTEASLFIEDLNQSPFNVGTEIRLEDFTFEQVADLNRLYGSPLRDDAEVRRFFDFVGGHPYLVSRGLCWMAENKKMMHDLVAVADQERVIFHRHLKEIWEHLESKENLRFALHEIICSQGCQDDRIFYTLWSSGLAVRDERGRAKIRCQLYQKFFSRKLQIAD